jgi:hypothetical protein
MHDGGLVLRCRSLVFFFSRVFLRLNRIQRDMHTYIHTSSSKKSIELLWTRWFSSIWSYRKINLEKYEIISGCLNKYKPDRAQNREERWNQGWQSKNFFLFVDKRTNHSLPENKNENLVCNWNFWELFIFDIHYLLTLWKMISQQKWLLRVLKKTDCMQIVLRKYLFEGARSTFSFFYRL